MNEINWIQLAIGFLSGGAFGAFIKQYFDNRRNRIQPISNSVELKSFYDSGENKLISSEIILKDGETEYKFEKLFTGTIQLLNSGLADYKEFTFGVTVPKNVKFIQVNCITADRHHEVELLHKPSLSNQISTFDVLLKPFNRKDNCSFDFVITTTSGTLTESNIQISSPHSVRWIKLKSTSEIIFEIANRTLIEIVTNRIVNIIRI